MPFKHFYRGMRARSLFFRVRTLHWIDKPVSPEGSKVIEPQLSISKNQLLICSALGFEVDSLAWLFMHPFKQDTYCKTRWI